MFRALVVGLVLLGLSCGGGPGQAGNGAIDLFETPTTDKYASWGGGVLVAPTTPPRHPIDGAPPGTPKPETTMVAQGAVIRPFTTDEVADAAFQCGSHAGATVLCASPGPAVAGNFVVAWFKLEDTLPLADQTLTYQYGFVIDRSGVANYEPAQFPWDFFFGTDIWFTLVSSPGKPMAVQVKDAAGGTIKDIASKARVIVQGSFVMVLIPAEELGVLEQLGYRVTAHCHEGDYGAVKPWSGATSPNVGVPLAPVRDPCEGVHTCTTEGGTAVTVTRHRVGNQCVGQVGEVQVTFSNGVLQAGTGSSIGSYTEKADRTLGAIVVDNQPATCAP